MKNKLSTEAYKGTRDFYPEDKFIQEYIFNKMRQVVEAFGYEEYDASILEPTDLYRAKTGEEIINEQTYSFTDRGNRDVTMRPEMTPTLARMVARKKRELVFPLRWYSIVNNFRYERPQKGRLREFWQLNVDLFGLKGLEAETEMIKIAYEIMIKLGASDEDFKIKISYAGLLGSIITETLGLDETQKKPTLRLIDRWGSQKITDEEFNTAMNDLLPEEQAKKLNDAILNNKIKVIAGEKDEMQLCRDLKDKLENIGIEVEIDPLLVRGLEYYTGIVFEVTDTNPDNNRSMFGGGRYDDLLDIFGAEKTPTVGFGMGDVTAREFMESRNLLPKYSSMTDLYLCILGQDYTDFADELARELRVENINVAVDYSYKKAGDQIKKADKKSIPFTICIGENEVKNKEFVMKRLEDGKEYKIRQKEIKDIICGK